ncbi:hypothetical protein OJAV_G00214690 [Oryzias javanicus]|uniref:Uncharacterized protein n=1 Tax=Oryzias javanicus TaxID=123683 RepID=A0A437C3P0_ORYJA|nr:hypothetical protein OJAV_G00214690 [Oryzias javanicus]
MTAGLCIVNAVFGQKEKKIYTHTHAHTPGPEEQDFFFPTSIQSIQHHPTSLPQAWMFFLSPEIKTFASEKKRTISCDVTLSLLLLLLFKLRLFLFFICGPFWKWKEGALCSQQLEEKKGGEQKKKKRDYCHKDYPPPTLFFLTSL